MNRKLLFYLCPLMFALAQSVFVQLPSVTVKTMDGKAFVAD